MPVRTKNVDFFMIYIVTYASQNKKCRLFYDLYCDNQCG